MKRTYDLGEARGIAERLTIDFGEAGFDLEQFRAGLDVEAEHGNADPSTNVTGDDPLTTGKIALAHLNEIPDYYTRLAKMEADASPVQATGDASSGTGAEAAGGVGKKVIIGLALLVFGAAAIVCLRLGRHRQAGRAGKR
jgi:Protein of unknown function (DUF5661)